MNSKVQKALNLKSIWGKQNSEVFSTLSGDFMKPVIDKGN